jgi:carbon monoxide dehydrogenase subunit G
MPSAEFSRDIEVAARPEICWPVLIDVQKVASWVSIVGDVEEIAPLSHYRTVLVDRFGPFRLKADVDVRVTEVEEGERVRLRASGSDRQVNSTIDVVAELRLEPLDGSTRIAVSGRYSVIGTVATMGAGTIEKKAEAVLEEFFGSLAAELGAL